MLEPNRSQTAVGLLRRIVQRTRRLLGVASEPAPTGAPEVYWAPAANVMEFKARALAQSVGKPADQVGGMLYSHIGQSELFMADLLPVIQALYVDHPREPSVRVLDVGPAYCFGSDLLARVFHRHSFAAFTVAVEAVDLYDWYSGPIAAIAPNVAHRIADVANIPGEGGWNLVIASHVIEHVPDPIGFALELHRHASDALLIACPWKEKELIEGHCNRIDETLLEQLRPSHVRIYESAAWKSGESCVIMLFPKRPLTPEQERRLAGAGMGAWTVSA